MKKDIRQLSASAQSEEVKTNQTEYRLEQRSSPEDKSARSPDALLDGGDFTRRSNGLLPMFMFLALLIMLILWYLYFGDAYSG
jgi:hypothetical protein